MDASEAWQVVADGRRDLADLLAGLAPSQWATPSLASGWTVRDVVAHLTVGPAGSPLAFAGALLRSRGSFARTNHLLATRRAAALPTAGLVDALREHAEDRFTPPGFDWHAPLADLRIHTLDVCLPLGLDPGQSGEPWREVLDLLTSRRSRVGFVAPGRPAVSVVASDPAWEGGDGPEVRGPARALALALSGRSALLGELEGPGVAPLGRWLAS